MMANVFEFRGTDGLVIAEVTKDEKGGITWGTPEDLVPVAQIEKQVETGAETKYYDNNPALTINSEGADTINLTVSGISLETLGKILNKPYENGMFSDEITTPKYFALGYRVKKTDGTYRYVWRYKGTFGVPGETSQTEDAGTTSNNQTLTYTGISTTAEFTKADGTKAKRKGFVVDEAEADETIKAKLAKFFEKVQVKETFEA